MNNKYIKHLSSLLIVLGLLSTYSCNDYLDKNPDNRLELDSEDKIKMVLISAYPQASHFLLTELASDNTDENGSGAYPPFGLTQEQSYRWQDVVSDEIDTPYDIWRKYYYSIQTACAALEAIRDLQDKGEVKNVSLAKGIESEALLCRAYGHFILVNLFSQTYGESSNSDLGIPYVLDADENLLVEYDRGTVEEVYQKIEKDLEEALPNVNNINQNIRKYHWNKQAAYAFAARFYLFYKKYDKAIHYASLALGDNPASILRDWAADGSNASKDNIANDRYIAVDQTCNFLMVAAESIWGRVSGPYVYGKGMAMQPITTLEIAPNTTLPIGGWLRYPYQVLGSGAVVVTHKVGEYFEYLDKNAGIGWTHIVQVLFTAEETLLVRAEAYALSNQLDEATKDLDTFLRAYTYYQKSYQHTDSKEKLIAFMKSKPFYVPTESVDVSFKKKINLQGISEYQENVLYGILVAKRSLTTHEGLRWFDINRYKIEIYRRTIYEGTPFVTDKLEINDLRRAFQIPQQIVAAGMEPNPR